MTSSKEKQTKMLFLLDSVMMNVHVESLIDLNVKLLKEKVSHHRAHKQYIERLTERQRLLSQLKTQLDGGADLQSKDYKKANVRMEEVRNNSINHLKKIVSLQEEIMEQETIHELDSKSYWMAVRARYEQSNPKDNVIFAGNKTQAELPLAAA